MKPFAVRSWSLSVFSLTALLSACGSLTSPGNTNPPVQHLNALTLGDAAGKVVSNLQNVSLEKYSGAQDLSKYDLLVVDGDSNSAQTIKTHPLLKQALALHKPLLFVDVSEDHKRNGIGSLIGFSSKGISDGLLVVPNPQASGRTFYHIFGTSSAAPAAQSAAGRALTKADNTAASDQFFASSLASNIRAATPVQGGLRDSAPPPAGVLSMQWIYTSQTAQMLYGSAQAKQGTQAYSDVFNYTYSLFYDTKQKNQVLDISMDGSVTPGTLMNQSVSEQAWFVAYVDTIMNVFDGRLNWVSNNPIAANTTTSYSSGSSFSVGFDGLSGSGDYAWNSEKQYSIPDWSVQSLGSQSYMDWHFMSSNPSYDDKTLSCVKNFSGNCPWSYWFITGAHVKSPNTLSLTQSEYHADATYRTTSPLNDFVDVTAYSAVSLADIHTDHKSDGTPQFLWEPVQTINDNGEGNSIISLNFGAVLPIQAQAITYNYERAPAGSSAPITGTVILASPAIVDTPVYLTATGTANTTPSVQQVVTVPAGQTSATFPITVSGDSVNGSTTDSSISVTAYTGTVTPITVPLLTRTYANGSMQPPITSPVADPANWAETTNHAPAGSRWQAGYQVRYAVSFVDAEGNEARGPWTDWFNYGTSDGNTSYALPYLTQIPTDPSNKAVARRVYRQFYSDILTHQNPDGEVIQPDGNGNSMGATGTNFRDNTW